MRIRTGLWTWLLGLASLLCFSALPMQESAAALSCIEGAVVGWGRMKLPYVDPAARFASLSSGGGHNLALQPDGKVIAWGANDYGQAAAPASLTGIVAVAAGYQARSRQI